VQGCQIFLDAIYQNGEKCIKLLLNYKMAIKYVSQKSEIYSKWISTIPKFSISRPSKIYPDWDFGLKLYVPSDSPVLESML
jgi:predicted DNA-binding protein YlxM (UPF0122 family)